MRTVFSVEPVDHPSTSGNAEPSLGVKAKRAQIMVPRAGIREEIGLSAGAQPPWTCPNAVRARGSLILQKLRTHPGLLFILDHLACTPAGQVSPIYLELSGAETEQISWETLCDQNNNFLALDPRWPIGRISDPMNFQSHSLPELRTPVKLLAVISAYGVNGQKKEWQMLRDATKAAREAGLEVELRLLVADNETRDAVNFDIQAGLAGVKLDYIKKSSSEVVTQIMDWQPNIVHFFCHGRPGTTPFEQAIEIATAADYVAGSGASVTISANQLVHLGLNLHNPWLLTLNCCSGGEATKELNSIAHQAVSAGFPAAVAMIEPVAAQDAYDFTSAFYTSLFHDLRKSEEDLKTQAQTTFEWAQTLYYARAVISETHERDPSNMREWTLPVLYVRGVDPMPFLRPQPNVSIQIENTCLPKEGAGNFDDMEVAGSVNFKTRGVNYIRGISIKKRKRIKIADYSPYAIKGDGNMVSAMEADYMPIEIAADYMRKAKVISDWLVLVRDDSNEGLRRAVMEKTLAEVPKEFWPNVDGKFGHG